MLKSTLLKLSAALSLGLLSACMTESTKAPSRPAGEARVSIKLEKAGSLAKASDIEMTELILTFSADGEETFHDTLPLSGFSTQSQSKTYDLAAEKTWSLSATAQDENAVAVYSGYAEFIVPEDGSENVSLTLSADYSMLKAHFYPVRDSVTRFELWVDESLAQSVSFTKQARLGDTLTLAEDYLSATPWGEYHVIRLEAHGSWNGEDRLLYEGQVQIPVFSGEDASHSVALRWVGPLNKGAAAMTVTLGAVGKVNIDGWLSEPATVVANRNTIILYTMPGQPDVNNLGPKNRGALDEAVTGAYDVHSPIRTLLHFEVPAVYTSANIYSAVIRLTPREWTIKNQEIDFEISLHALLKSWKEGTGSNEDNSALVDGASALERFWGDQDGSEDWSEPLVGLNDIDAASAPAATVTKPTRSTQKWEFDVTELARQWADDPESNHGVITVTPFVYENENIPTYPHFYSRKSPVADGLKPVLIINGRAFVPPPPL